MTQVNEHECTQPTKPARLFRAVVYMHPHQLPSSHLRNLATGKQRVYTVWYPTLRSLHERLDLATQYHAGVSIWELGQGMDYFLDLL